MSDGPREPNYARSRPWSIDETLEPMEQLEDQLGKAIDPLLEVGDRASEAKWAYRNAIREAIESGAIAGLKNQQEREAKIRGYQPKAMPGKTVADLGQEADRWANRLLTTNTAVKALIKQADLSQSLHVTAREGAP